MDLVNRTAKPRIFVCSNHKNEFKKIVLEGNIDFHCLGGWIHADITHASEIILLAQKKMQQM